MNTKERREALLKKLQTAEGPVTGTALSQELGVSRQVIVGDIAILRAAGMDVYATPQGYVMPQKQTMALTSTLACRHTREQLAEELHIIVDNGGKVLDVVVEHPLYGEIRGNLMLTSRREVAEFLSKLEQTGANPLSIVTGGVHLHTVEISDKEGLRRMKKELKEKGILLK